MKEQLKHNEVAIQKKLRWGNRDEKYMERSQLHSEPIWGVSSPWNRTNAMLMCHEDWKKVIDGTQISTLTTFTKVRLFLGLGFFLDQKDTVWCLASFKQVEQHFPSIFKSYSHSYYAETYPSLWVVFKSSETSIRAFTTSVHYLAYFCGQQIPWNWGCSITRGLSQFDHVTSRWHCSVASWRLTSFGDKVCNKSQKRI